MAPFSPLLAPFSPLSAPFSPALPPKPSSPAAPRPSFALSPSPARNTAGKVYDQNAPQLTPEQFTAETAAVVRLIDCRRKAKPTN